MGSRLFEEELRLIASNLSEASQKLQALATVPRATGRKVYTLSEIVAHARPLSILARKEHQARRLREELIPCGHFGEPAWDLLIDLFAHSIIDKPIHKSSAQIAAHCPPTTALRYIDHLENEGMLVQQKSETDGRVILLRLTDAALVCVGSYFMNTSQLNEGDFDD